MQDFAADRVGLAAGVLKKIWMSRGGTRGARGRGVGLAMVGLVLGQPSISGGAHGGRQGLAGITTWAVVYGREVAPARLKPFGLVVVDSDVAQQTAALKWSGAKILAYLSLGEVRQARSYFAQVRSAGWLVRENPKSKGSFMVNVPTRAGGGWSWSAWHRRFWAAASMGCSWTPWIRQRSWRGKTRPHVPGEHPGDGRASEGPTGHLPEGSAASQ